jgi:2-polyprenyl-3-methyl-5-hydroxy-6-metoxy-1,4-benzoquinol methylase
MINLSTRSKKKELLDEEDIPFDDIKQNMQELNAVNTLLGGHAISLQGIKAILGKKSGATVICEIGCGGGDNLQVIARWCKKKNIPAKFTGIDIKPECIAFAKQQNPGLDATWITSDFKLAALDPPPDIIFSSLFCHHFPDEELVNMFRWMWDRCDKGFFINDLHRHPVAYYSIRWLTRLFSRSYLVKHDAPLSVARAFRKKELQALLQKAGIGNYSVRWKWAFRYLVVCKKP